MMKLQAERSRYRAYIPREFLDSVNATEPERKNSRLFAACKSKLKTLMTRIRNIKAPWDFDLENIGAWP